MYKSDIRLILKYQYHLLFLFSLPLTSFPIFEKILAFLFQRIQVNYNTVVSTTSVDHQYDNVSLFVVLLF